MLNRWAERIQSHTYMSRYAPHPGKSILWCVIQADGMDIGTVWLESADPRAAVLGILLGDPDIFGQGIGTRAIELAIQRARDEVPVDVVRLDVRASNKRAIACYERCGFRIAESGTRESHGLRYDFFTMEKRLRPSRPSTPPQ